ncbi:MAG: hypothetical protein SGPRY_008835 [Prymnesium sp.]
MAGNHIARDRSERAGYTRQYAFASAVGGWIGLLLPRVADPEALIRQRAASALLSLIRIAASARAHWEDPPSPPEVMEAMPSSLERAKAVLSHAGDASELERRMGMQQQLVGLIEPSESPGSMYSSLVASTLRELARSLVGGLASEWQGAAAACVALDSLLHCSFAPACVGEVLSLLLEVTPRIEEEMPKQGAMAVGRRLARCSVDGVMECLLEQPAALPPQVPLDTSSTKL